MRTAPFICTALVFVSYCVASVPARSAPCDERFCGEPWGWVSVNGTIVAADVSKHDSRRLVFGKAIAKVHPSYPSTARADRVTGRVFVIARVSADGRVVDAEVRFGARSDLDAAALRAAKGWRFVPTTAAEAKVAAYAQIVFDFTAEPAPLDPPN